MSNYECIKTKFSHVDYYIKNAIVQKNVRGKLINKCKNILRKNSIESILNIGVRDINEPIDLYNKFSPKKIDVIDLTLKNIDKATKGKNISFHELNFDYDLDKLSQNYDLIFSNMSIQWSNDLNKLLKVLEQKLNQGSILAFSTLLDENFHEVADIFRVNEMLPKESILKSIKNNSLLCLHVESSFHTLNFKTFKDLTNHFKSTGISTYISEWNNINIHKIRNLIKSNSTYNLSYHVVLFICYKQ